MSETSFIYEFCFKSTFFHCLVVPTFKCSSTLSEGFQDVSRMVWTWRRPLDACWDRSKSLRGLWLCWHYHGISKINPYTGYQMKLDVYSWSDQQHTPNTARWSNIYPRLPRHNTGPCWCILCDLSWPFVCSFCEGEEFWYGQVGKSARLSVGGSMRPGTCPQVDASACNLVHL